MQPTGEKKASDRNQQLKEQLDHFDSLVEKNRHAYDDAIRDFRNRFTIGSAGYEDSCD